jgi:hypothetical protein
VDGLLRYLEEDVPRSMEAFAALKHKPNSSFYMLSSPISCKDQQVEKVTKMDLVMPGDEHEEAIERIGGAHNPATAINKLLARRSASHRQQRNAVGVDETRQERGIVALWGRSL